MDLRTGIRGIRLGTGSFDVLCMIDLEYNRPRSQNGSSGTYEAAQASNLSQHMPYRICWGVSMKSKQCYLS